ncbi:hypothetical protein BRC96_08995 [Halobacteriales archaeon QS_6_64_34]|nr:MAG: hypothetical protein BRC96_08995 [Halobacteriales archaeon QS_6_64_34]
MASERDLRRDIENLKDRATTEDPTDIRVVWRNAAPDERPDGMDWRPPTDDDPARLAYDLWAGQRDTYDAVESGEYDITAFLGGYGSGKSVLGARWLLAKALKNSGSRFLCMGQDFQKAKNTTYPKLFQALPGARTDLLTSGHNGPETSPIVADFNRQDYRLTLINDSVITLGSADDYARYAGAEFGAAWLDEPSHYGDDLHDLVGMITTRLRGVDGPKTQLWTLTGEGYNAAWEILEKRQDADGDSIGLNIEVLTASVLDNPYLPQGEIEHFKRKYEGTEKEQQALHGGFAAATGLVYSNFSRDAHVIPHTDAVGRVEDDWRIYGYDAGWNDPRVLLEIGRTPYDQLVVLGEFYESGTHAEDAIQWATETPDGTIYAEHVPAEIEKFERAGWDVKKAVKDIDAGIAEVRRRLDSDGNMEVSSAGPFFSGALDPSTGEWTSFTSTAVSQKEANDPEHGDHVGLLVSDNCAHLIREFLGYKEEHVGKGTATDHALDALRYAVMGASGDD